MSSKQATIAIAALRRAVGYQGRKFHEGAGKRGHVGGPLTQQQAQKIGALERELGWQNHPARLRGFIERQIGTRKAVEWLRNYEAQKVILGLERVLEFNLKKG